MNNPDVDRVWELEMSAWDQMEVVWSMFEREAIRLHGEGLYDHVFLTQISPGRFGSYDGTIRPSIFRNYGRPITVPVETVIRLTPEEIARVDEWVEKSPAADAPYTILFECSSKSGQSFMTPGLAVDVAERVTRERHGAVVMISTHEPFATDNPRIISAGALSMRENARLTNYVDLFVGCGSGLTVVATSSAAKPDLPTVQVLSRATSVYASFRHDFEFFGKPADRFLECTSSDPDVIARTVLAVVHDGIETARKMHDDPVPLTFDWYLGMIDRYLVQRGAYADAANSLSVTAQRYGAREELVGFARREIMPFLDLDPASRFPDRERSIADFRARFSASSRVG